MAVQVFHSSVKASPFAVKPSPFSATFPEKFSRIRQRFGASISNAVFYSLDRGKAILESAEQAEQFLCTYGPMHEAKMKNACAPLLPHLMQHSESQFELIDYACGQGLASIVLLNQLQEQGFSASNVASINLIEPSPVTLNRALNFLDGMQVLRSHQCKLDALTASNLSTQQESVKVHLFSNILDMGNTAFNLEQLANTIKTSQTGVNYFVCVSPRYNNCIDRFASFFQGMQGELILDVEGPVQADKTWTQKICVFKVIL